MSGAPCPAACAGCRDNFLLPELHQHGPLTVFDSPAIRGQIERRRACGLVPDSEKPCLKPAPALDEKAQAAIETVAKSSPSDLPTQAQVMRLACVAVEGWLTCGVEHACELAAWRDEWEDATSAAELALDAISRLNAALPVGPHEFERVWCTLSGAVRLVVEVFPDKDTAAWRFFKSAAQNMTVFAGALEFVAPERGGCGRAGEVIAQSDNGSHGAS